MIQRGPYPAICRVFDRAIAMALAQRLYGSHAHSSLVELREVLVELEGGAVVAWEIRWSAFTSLESDHLRNVWRRDLAAWVRQRGWAGLKVRGRTVVAHA